MKKQNGIITKFESTAKFALIVVALAVMTGCTATATVGSVSTPPAENQVPEEIYRPRPASINTHYCRFPGLV